MKEIKFRGKRLNNGEWVYGYYIKYSNTEQYIKLCRYIGEGDEVEVDLTTIGQFTGFIDINGIESYENDIVKDGTGKVFVIRRIGGTGTQPHSFGNFTQFQCCTPCKDGKWSIAPKATFHGMKVIGNIHDNSEILGVS